VRETSYGSGGPPDADRRGDAALVAALGAIDATGAPTEIGRGYGARGGPSARDSHVEAKRDAASSSTWSLRLER
jgi:hypothetical protein